MSYKSIFNSIILETHKLNKYDCYDSKVNKLFWECAKILHSESKQRAREWYFYSRQRAQILWFYSDVKIYTQIISLFFTGSMLIWNSKCYIYGVEDFFWLWLCIVEKLWCWLLTPFFLYSFVFFFWFVEATKEWMMERKETGILLNSIFILRVYNYFVVKIVFLNQ